MQYLMVLHVTTLLISCGHHQIWKQINFQSRFSTTLLEFFSVTKCKQNKALSQKTKKYFLLFEICNLTLQSKSRFKYSNIKHLANGTVSQYSEFSI